MFSAERQLSRTRPPPVILTVSRLHFFLVGQ